MSTLYKQNTAVTLQPVTHSDPQQFELLYDAFLKGLIVLVILMIINNDISDDYLLLML